MNNFIVQDFKVDYIVKISGYLEQKINKLSLAKLSFCYSKQNEQRFMFNPIEEQCVLAYVQKYDSLLGLESFDVKSPNDSIEIEDYQARAILNDYRPIIMNQSDISYYTKTVNFCKEKLSRRNNNCIEISVENQNKEDVTKNYIQFIDYSINILKKIVKDNDFHYVYNGILQHSDPKYLKRAEADIHSEEIQSILRKHTIACMAIKECLMPISKVLCSTRGFIDY